MWQPEAARRHRRSPGSPVYFGVVEPGSTALRLLVVEVADGQASVLGWAEGPGWTGTAKDARPMAAACGNALARAEEMAQAAGDRWVLPDQMVVGLPASYLRGRAWSVRQRRSRPDRPVDEQELTALLERALRLTVNRLRGTGSDEAGWLLVEAAPVALTVDGHGVTDPVGFRGHEIAATVFAALARAEVIQTWGLVARELEFTALTLTAMPLALAPSLAVSPGILVDVGGATTDLIWCQRGGPVVLESMTTGGIALTRSLSRAWQVSQDRAEQLKRAYGGGSLPPEVRAQVQEALWPCLQDWLEEMETAMARMSQEQALPQQLMLLGGGSALPEMSEAVRALAWSQRLRFERYPQVGHLRPTDVPGVVNCTGRGREMSDVSALALAAWIARQHRPPERPEAVLRDLCQG